MKRKPLKYYQASKNFDFSTEEYDKLSISQLKKQADYWMRQYLLRETESRFGKYFCPLKKAWLPANQMEVAHFIDRSFMWSRYELKNCHLVSKQSNSFDAQILKEGYKSLHHFDYESYLKDEYGENTIKVLLDMSEEKLIFGRENYIEKIKFFRDESRSVDIT